MADGMHSFDKTFVRVNGVEKLLLYLRGIPKFHLLMEEINQKYVMETFQY